MNTAEDNRACSLSVCERFLRKEFNQIRNVRPNRTALIAGAGARLALD